MNRGIPDPRPNLTPRGTTSAPLVEEITPDITTAQARAGTEIQQGIKLLVEARRLSTSAKDLVARVAEVGTLWRR